MTFFEIERYITGHQSTVMVGGWGNDRPKNGEGDLEIMPFIYLLFFEDIFWGLKSWTLHIDTTVEMERAIMILGLFSNLEF